MVTRDALCLAIVIFPDEVGKRNFYNDISMGTYSAWLMEIDTYQEVVKKMYLLLLLLGMYLSLDR